MTVVAQRIPFGEIRHNVVYTGGVKTVATTKTPVAKLPISPSTCAPSVLHHLGFGQYSATLMEYGVFVVSDIRGLSYEVLFSMIPDTECCDMLREFVKPRVTSVRCNNPYQWQVITREPQPAIAKVNFKLSHSGTYNVPAELDVQCGQYVIVTGDRGVDLGVVTTCYAVAAEEVESNQHDVDGSVIKLATSEEVEALFGEVAEAEAAALQWCRGRVARFSLSMEVTAAEYQFDYKKLTFFYNSEGRVDFVYLLKDLFREFGCRIWMSRNNQAQDSLNEF